jgi:hypothetical protein
MPVLLCCAGHPVAAVRSKSMDLELCLARVLAELAWPAWCCLWSCCSACCCQLVACVQMLCHTMRRTSCNIFILWIWCEDRSRRGRRGGRCFRLIRDARTSFTTTASRSRRTVLTCRERQGSICGITSAGIRCLGGRERTRNYAAEDNGRRVRQRRGQRVQARGAAEADRVANETAPSAVRRARHAQAFLRGDLHLN